MEEVECHVLFCRFASKPCMISLIDSNTGLNPYGEGGRDLHLYNALILNYICQCYRPQQKKRKKKRECLHTFSLVHQLHYEIIENHEGKIQHSN